MFGDMLVRCPVDCTPVSQVCLYIICLYIHVLLPFLYSKVSHIELGEEVDYDFVASTMDVAKDLWNHAVTKLREKLSDPASILSVLDKKDTSNLTPEHLETAVEEVRTHVASLKEIKMSSSDGVFLPLGSDLSVFFIFTI